MTLDTSQWPIGWLNTVFVKNLWFVAVTLEVFTIGWFKTVGWEAVDTKLCGLFYQQKGAAPPLEAQHSHGRG